MACACIKANGFNLNLTYIDCNNIIIEDYSNWVYSEKTDIPKTFNIQIESLDKGIKKEIELKSDCKNKISSKDLFGSELECIPDGFFCITTESCGVTYTITRALLHNSEIELMKIVAREVNNLDTDMLRILNESYLLIDSIKINAQLGNYNIGRDLFKKLKRKLKNFRCDNC